MQISELSPDEITALIDYARQKYAEEPWPLAHDLRAVRKAIEKLRGRPEPLPLPERKPYEPSTLARSLRTKRR